MTMTMASKLPQPLLTAVFLMGIAFLNSTCQVSKTQQAARSVSSSRERIKLNEGWRFMRYRGNPDKLIYDLRSPIQEVNDSKVADSKPTEATLVNNDETVLKPWILPSANAFIKDPSKRHLRPAGNPGADFPFLQASFADEGWELVNLPHDWAIKGPFYAGDTPEVGGGMGRLPSQGGGGWYRKKINISDSDRGRNIYLDVDGAMSYAMVWLNDQLVGGCPYGYNSFQLDLTPYLNFGGDNQLAIRVDNPNHSARRYPGGGLYRNVWPTKLAPTHIAQWGVFIKTPEVSTARVTIEALVRVDNNTASEQTMEVRTELYALDDSGQPTGKLLATFPAPKITLKAGESQSGTNRITLENPKLWSPYPTQVPHLYVARTYLQKDGKPVDTHETPFGIEKLNSMPSKTYWSTARKLKFRA